MQMIHRLGRNARWTKGGGVFGLILGVLLQGGCATTTVSMEEPPTVTESRAKRDLGIDYLSTRRTGMAIRELTQSLELDASDPKTHLWLGEAFRRKGQTDKAEEFLRDAVRLSDADRDGETGQRSRLSLSALMAQMGRYEEALEHCEHVANDPTFSTPWKPLSNCGWSLMKLGRLEEARKHFDDALEFFPKFGPALLNLGILEAKEGHQAAAIKMFQRAIDSGRVSSSGFAEANYRLGELFVALGRRDQAVTHFREAAKVSPDIEWGTQSQAYLDLLR